MVLNIQTLKTRSLTAAIFVVVMAAGLFTGPWMFFLLFSIIHFGCWREYQKLVGKIDPDYQQISSFHKAGVQIAGWCIMMYFTNDYFAIGSLSLHSLGFWLGLIFVFVLPIVELLFSRDVIPRNIGYSIFGIVYISLSWGTMIGLRTYGLDAHSHQDNGWIFPCVLIFSIWINDTMAYVVGSLIGRTPFSSISPKKTWEGTIGGAVLCCLVIGFGASALFNITRESAFGISAIAAVLGTVGDLLESKFKRLAGVKDSGSLMPGHGGFLDRFDSLLLATPFVFIYVIILYLN